MNRADFPKNKERKREEAKVRQAHANILTPAQRLAHLDVVLGVGSGAKKERARLQSKLDKVKLVETSLIVEPSEPGERLRLQRQSKRI
jgi:hypothetical protein